MKLIVLGGDCSISFQCINLNIKEESSLFEWHAIGDFKQVNGVLKEFLEKGMVDIQVRESLPGNLFMGSNHVHSAHYTIDMYPGLIKRRWDRFVSHVNSTFVLFIYEDFGGLTTKEDIQEFKQLIERMNPSADYALLLLSKEDNFSQIQEDRVFHRKINKQNLLPYIQEACSPHQVNRVCSDRNDKD